MTDRTLYDMMDYTKTSPTEILYFNNYLKTEFEAKVIDINDNDVILDKTCFYPTSGGQLHDLGTLGGIPIRYIFKQGAVVVHELISKPTFKPGDIVDGNIYKKRRIQLSQHHTATHIINGAARKVLGEHIWQAGAEKTETKARLDITHYPRNILGAQIRGHYFNLCYRTRRFIRFLQPGFRHPVYSIF